MTLDALPKVESGYPNLQQVYDNTPYPRGFPDGLGFVTRLATLNARNRAEAAKLSKEEAGLLPNTFLG